MTNTIFQSNNTAQLNSYFTQLVSNLMVIEKRPLQQITATRDTINVQHGAYLDATTKLQALQDTVAPLTTVSPFSILTPARSTSVTGAPTGKTVLSASAGSSALPGTYNISVTTLAKEQRVRSDRQVYADQALSLSGQILLGGAAARSQITQATTANTVTGFGTASLATDHTELGSGTYFVETRQDATAGWQFRLVDANGQAVTVAKTDATGNTANWQSMPTSGSFDTGRGLTVTLGTDSSQYVAADKSSGAAAVKYTAQGASISVTTGQSLNDIASAINGATYADGNGVSATVVDNQLILAAASTGTQHGVGASDASGTVLKSLGVLTAGGGFKNSIQDATDAAFSVNGVNVVRGSNTVSDVISGVSLNLAKDAEGQGATLTVSNDTSAIKTGLQSFITQFNSVQTYLDNETRVRQTTNADGSKTYTPATLSNDSAFGDLRIKLFAQFSTENTSGAYRSLAEIGLSIDANMQISIGDSTKLDTALGSHLADVGKLFDTVMGSFNSLLTGYTAPTTGYLSSAAKGLDQQLTDTNARIADITNQLNAKQKNLTDQFAGVQAQLAQLSYNQQTWQSIYGASTGSSTFG